MANFSKQLIYKVYNESGTFLSVLNDVISDFSISKEINGGDSEFSFVLDRKMDDFDEDNTIKFNNRIKVYLKDSYNPSGDKLIAYGYITSYKPFLNKSSEGVEVTCLSAISKLSNDFYRSGTSLDASDLGVQLSSQRADQMMQAIITHYTTVETNSMLSTDFSNVDATTDNVGGSVTFTHRFFNMKHLDALRESYKFFPKNKTGGYWFYWKINTDGKLYVKNISSTADHTFIIGKHIDEIDGSKTIEDVVNRVYFWNEKGTADPDYIKLTADDSTSQDDYDIVAEYLTDSKITNSTAANLVSSSKIYDKKDPKVRIKILLNNRYDLSSITPGHTCKILNAKNNPYKIGSDTVLLIHSVNYEVDSATLELSDASENFADIVEEERQRLDKEMTWFGYITQQLTAAQLAPANRVWTTSVRFSAVSGADAYRNVQWTAGNIYIPTGSGETILRIIDSGQTGNMSAGLDYYIYLDEEVLNTSATTSDSGTGTLKQGGETMLDASKSWTVDQWQGYVVEIGSQKKIIKSNTATVLTIEDRWTISDQSSAYTIKKLLLTSTTSESTAASTSRIVFSNVKANTLTTSEAIIVPTRDPSINIDGSQIAKRSISADEIIANTITANEISTTLLYAGSIIIDTGGSIRSGQTAYDTGTGWWIGNVSGTPQFSFGSTVTGNKMTWSGSIATIVGVINATGGVFTGDVSTSAGIKAGTSGDIVQLNGINKSFEAYKSGVIRVKIDKDGVYWYDSSSNLSAQMTGMGSGNFRIESITGARIDIGDPAVSGDCEMHVSNYLATSNDLVYNEYDGSTGAGGGIWNGSTLIIDYNGEVYTQKIHGSTGSVIDMGSEAANILLNKNFVPSSDNTRTSGSAARRWSDVRTVLLNGADICLENDWKFREWPAKKEDVGKPIEWMQKNANLGIQILDENEELKAVIHKDGYIYCKGIKQLEDLQEGKNYV